MARQRQWSCEAWQFAIDDVREPSFTFIPGGDLATSLLCTGSVTCRHEDSHAFQRCCFEGEDVEGLEGQRGGFTMTVERSAWSGQLGARATPTSWPVISMPIQPSPRGGSGTFLAADDEHHQWWVKPLNNAQGQRVVITETVIAAVGRLIGAPVCETSIVCLPPEIAGWEFKPGLRIEAGLAHGSRAVEGVEEERQLLHIERDDNAVRHAGTFALYDWCWGGDDQWLYALPEDRRLYSHDHGWYLPETGPNWTVATLESYVDLAHPAPRPADGLAEAELTRLASALRGLTRAQLVEALRGIPMEWPVSNEELEAVGWFLERRAPEVAGRIEALVSVDEGGSE